MDKGLRSSADAPGTVNQGATDTHTIAIAAGYLPRWYGTLVSTGRVSAAADAEVRVKVGTTVVARATLQDTNTLPVNVTVLLAPPNGGFIQGAGGEDISIEFEGLAGGNWTYVDSTTYYDCVAQPRGN